MAPRSILPILLAATALLLPPAALPAQAAQSAAPVETIAALVGKLNPHEKAAFQQARQDFQARRFGAALAIARQLRAKLPADPLLTQFAAASAVNAGEPSAAVAMLKPLAHHDPANWVAARMLVRACAEAGDTACRDAEMSRVAALCLTGVTPPGFSHYCVEDIKPGPARSLLFGNTWCHLGHFMFISGGRFSAPAGG